MMMTTTQMIMMMIITFIMRMIMILSGYIEIEDIVIVIMTMTYYKYSDHCNDDDVINVFKCTA